MDIFKILHYSRSSRDIENSKNHEKGDIIHSTLTFRQCDGGNVIFFMIFAVFDVLITACRR